MSTDNVDDLIKQLEEIKLQETTVLRRLVIARASEVRAASTQEPSQPGSEPATSSFRIGDQVEITNRVNKPFGRNADINDRKGAVIKLTKHRVFIRTVNGGTTNRAPQNLKPALP